MARVHCISPVRLYRHSFLGGVILLLALVLLCADLAIIGMRAYAFNTLQRWSLEDGIAGLDGLAYSLLVAVLWLITMAFLLVDVVTALLLPSRDLQEGAVIAFGIISIMQVPIVALYLKWELSLTNGVWVQRACTAVAHSTDCTTWYSRVRLVSIVSSSIATGVHLLLVALCARYVHTRPAKLYEPHRAKKQHSKTASERSKKGGAGRLRGLEREFARLEDKLVRHKKPSRKAGAAQQLGEGLSSDGAGGAQPVAGRLSRSSSRASTTLPPYDPPHAAGAVHTDSDSEIEDKKLLTGRSGV
ncbi:hypothetical protein JCM3775_004567 [Rhodotorula graminis]|uniref:Uncharacterized protein n=1 Tax=Rhodotorula graminis (strain WP1) TaxID=578459 RepID=A0A194S8R7_RHOGW|nr:uncharacterized protein RHOBADRAFT_42200 [Rhodotorula graminis WP1]KPV76987.1 hypothetical protein RHOBADRAFT_42200 [Rhodotorula graminis WP1]